MITEVTFNDIYTESLRGKIGMKTDRIKDELTLASLWSKGMISRFRKFESHNISDKDFVRLHEEFSAAIAAENFSEYSKHYKYIADFCHFQVDGSTIHSYSLTKGKKGEDKNHLFVVYADSRKRIVIPNGMGIYHQSSSDNITELRPTFKARKNGLLYSKPRIYFSLRRNVPNFIVDQDKDTTLYVYTPKKKFTTGFIDSAAPLPTQNNIYFETMTPIPVEKIDVKKSKKDLKEEKAKKAVKESVDFDSLDDIVFESLDKFMEFYNLDYLTPDEDVLVDATITEGFKDTFKKITNKIGEYGTYSKDKKETDKKWLDQSKGIDYKKVNKKVVDKKTFIEAKKKYSVLCDSTIYRVYKSAYDFFAKLFGFSNSDSVIEFIRFSKSEKGEYIIHIRYGDKKKRITIPIGYNVVHKSPIDGIKELIPSFRSKTRGKYFYPKPRVYFSIGKTDIDPKKYGVNPEKKLHSYTPKYDYKFAFIDQSLPELKTGAVYLDVSHPIPVEKEEEKMMKETVNMTDFFISDF